MLMVSLIFLLYQFSSRSRIFTSQETAPLHSTTFVIVAPIVLSDTESYTVMMVEYSTISLHGQVTQAQLAMIYHIGLLTIKRFPSSAMIIICSA